ncbi:hypothetical protein C8Q73DRAFT_793718 [Cubamyces lactineus]|nr:hypothetical protein C8Q73DRAFT_793718 [Cubamyces lactineus]
MMDILPTELILRILAYLPLQALRNFRLSARRWNDFVVSNQSTIYHHAAVLHNFVDDLDILLPQAKVTRGLKFLQDVPDWYQYCRKYFQLQKNWAGEGSASAKYYGGKPFDIHRIKVDEEYGLVITTHNFGGLTVFDMDTTEVLWELSAGYVRRYAHCEYENGFLIFDRIGVSKEVWRLEALYNEDEDPVTSFPDESQFEAWQAASQQWPSTSQRGHFRPWALIDTPEFGRAYRFVYPNLLVSGLRKAYLWDVRSGELVLEVENVQGNTTDTGDINYVELSATHVFICSSSALRVFSRQNKSLVLEIPSYQLAYGDIRLAVDRGPAAARHGLASPSEVVKIPIEPIDTTALYTASYAEFSAVHVSRDGKDLFAQLSDSRVVAIRDFMRVARGEVTLKKATLEIGKTVPPQGMDEHFSIYLAFEHGRTAVITTSGIYPMTLDPTHHGLLDRERAARENVNQIPREAIDAGLSFPDIIITALPYYYDRRQLGKVSCVQMTETKMFFVWDAMYKPENIDFFRRLGFVEPLPKTAQSQTAASAAEASAVVVASGSGALDQETATQPEAGPSGTNTFTEHEGEEANSGWNPDDLEASAEIMTEPAATTADAEPEVAAGNSQSVTVDFVPWDDDDDEEWEDADEDDDGAGSFDEEMEDGAELPMSITEAGDPRLWPAGPIVFCIDFSPV